MNLVIPESPQQHESSSESSYDAREVFKEIKKVFFKPYFVLTFGPKTFKPFLNGPEPPKLVPNIFLQNYLNICRVI